MERGKVLREDLFQEIVFKHKPKSNDRASYLRPRSKLLITSSWPASQAEFRVFYEMLQSFLMPQPNSVVLPDFPVLCLAMWSSFFSGISFHIQFHCFSAIFLPWSVSSLLPEKLSSLFRDPRLTLLVSLCFSSSHNSLFSQCLSLDHIHSMALKYQ